MSARTDPDYDYPQARDLLAALGDDVQGRVIRLLLRRARSQKEIQDALGLGQPQVSRALKELRLLGLVLSQAGRDGLHRVRSRDLAFGVIRAADTLAEEINEYQSETQNRAARQTTKDQLAGDLSGRGADSA